MKNYFVFILSLILLSACTNHTGKHAPLASEEEHGKTIVYYFHGKQRCVSCITVQEVAQAAIDEHFADNPKVVFMEVDFSDPANRALSEKYEIVFSSLLIACDNKHTDLTEEAFSLVRNSEKLKERIREETEKYLNL